MIVSILLELSHVLVVTTLSPAIDVALLVLGLTIFARGQGAARGRRIRAGKRFRKALADGMVWA